MSDMRKNQILEEFRRPAGNKSSRSRDIKVRLHHLRGKDTFLTDTQTSDYTKSSGEINVSRIEHLEDTVRKLEKENHQLRQRVVDLKASFCFEINQEKLKNVIRETDRLRNDLLQTRKQLEQSLVERDFLERFNKNLKVQCETLTKEILLLKAAPVPQEARKHDKNIYTSREEAESSKSRNSSHERGLSSKRREFLQWKREKGDKGEKGERGKGERGEERGSQHNINLLKSSLSASQLHEDYYGGRSSRARPFKNH